MSSAVDHDQADLSLFLHAEDISIARQKIAGDTVRISTVTRESDRLVDETLTRERVEMERVPIDRRIDAVPPIREEGDVTIIPVVEEILVVERRLVLKEEVRIRRVRVAELHRETVTLRHQDIVVTRLPPERAVPRDTQGSSGTHQSTESQEHQT